METFQDTNKSTNLLQSTVTIQLAENIFPSKAGTVDDGTEQASISRAPCQRTPKPKPPRPLWVKAHKKEKKTS